MWAGCTDAPKAYEMALLRSPPMIWVVHLRFVMELCCIFTRTPSYCLGKHGIPCPAAPTVELELWTQVHGSLTFGYRRDAARLLIALLNTVVKPWVENAP